MLAYGCEQNCNLIFEFLKAAFRGKLFQHGLPVFKQQFNKDKDKNGGFWEWFGS